jgi:hypothetical protein
MNILKVSVMMGFIVGCVTTNSRVVLDKSPTKPTWVDSSKISWSENGKIFFKSSHTIRGNERIDGCYSLAQLDAKENLLSEISNDVKGTLDNAQENISEDAEAILGKVRSGEYAGKIQGLKFAEQYFERYKIEENERIECFLLSEITTADYSKTKKSVINKVLAADPRIKEAITKKHVNFFSSPAVNDSNDNDNIEQTVAH